jgi:hypothetical protein
MIFTQYASRQRLFSTLLLCALLVFGACAPAWKKKVHQYTFKSTDGKPDYAKLDYWAAHPAKWDPSDSVPRPLRNGAVAEKIADVFFIHPSTYTGKKDPAQWNARIDSAELNAFTDYTSILYQASVFNEQCRIFAPRYRQAHLQAFFTEKKLNALQSFELAYQDVKKAFDYYLKNENNGRPIIIAAHSQGTIHAGRLLQDFFEKKILQQQLVAAYIVGMPLPKNYFKTMQPCRGENETGCVAGWRTFREGYLPDYVQKEDTGYSFVVNPLNWQVTEGLVPASANKGSVLKKFNKIYYNTCNAQVKGNVLWASRPKFPFSFLIKEKNYHVGDINLFYVNIRNNVRLRLAEYMKNTRP